MSDFSPLTAIESIQLNKSSDTNQNGLSQFRTDQSDNRQSNQNASEPIEKGSKTDPSKKIKPQVSSRKPIRFDYNSGHQVDRRNEPKPTKRLKTDFAVDLLLSRSVDTSESVQKAYNDFDHLCEFS